MNNDNQYELCLPTSFSNIIVQEGNTGDSNGKWSLIIRTNIKDRQDAFRWKGELEMRSNVKYTYQYCKQDSSKVWKGTFVCACDNVASYNSNNIECPHKFTVCIEKNSSEKSDSIQDYFNQGYQCEIKFTDMHNHEIIPRLASSGEREAARREIVKLISSGMRPRDAIEHMQNNYPGFLPKPHVYYEVAKSLRIRQMRQELRLDEEEKSPKKSKIVVPLPKVKDSVQNKKVNISSLTENLIAEDQDPSTSKHSEKDIDINEKYFTLPTMTHKPINYVTIEQGSALVQQIMVMIERQYRRYGRDLSVRSAVEECYLRLEQVRTRQQFAAFLKNAAQEIETRYQGCGPLYYDTQKLALRHEYEVIEYVEPEEQDNNIEYILEERDVPPQAETPGVIRVD